MSAEASKGNGVPVTSDYRICFPYIVTHPDADRPAPRFATWGEALTAQVQFNCALPGHVARRDLYIGEVRQWLAEISAPVVASVSYCYWLNARNADTDQGLSYCSTCCEAHAVEMNQKNPAGDYFSDGGWPTDSDTVESCETCGMVLDTNLTEYAVAEELDYLKHHRLNLQGPRASYVAFRILQLLDGLSAVPESVTTKKLIRRLNAVRIRTVRLQHSK